MTKKSKDLSTWKSILAKSRTFETLSGKARLRVYEKGKRKHSYKVWFHLKRPNKIHIQVVGAFNQPALVVTSDGKRFALHNMLRKEFMYGKSDQLPRLLKEVLPSELSIHHLVSTLLGEIPFFVTGLASMEKQEGYRRKLIVLKGKKRQSIEWDARKTQISRSIFQQGTQRLEVSFRSFLPNGLPKVIRFLSSEKDSEFRWIYTETEKNAKVKKEYFEQEKPAGMQTWEVKGK